VPLKSFSSVCWPQKKSDQEAYLFSCLSRRSSSSAWPAGSDSAQKNWAQISRSNGNLLPPFVFLHKHFWFSWLFLFAFLSSFCIYYAPDVSSDHSVGFSPSSSISRGASDINSSICMNMFPHPHCASFISDFHSHILLQQGIYLAKLFSLGLRWDLLIGSPLESPAYRSSASHFPN
jgi:hypothetical protein